MFKTIVFIVLILSGYASASASKFSLKPNKHLERVISATKPGNNGLDFCPECIEAFGSLISMVLNAILEYGVFNTCGDLCEVVAQKSGSSFLGYLCTAACSFLGMDELVNLVNKADPDPLYYCEIIQICPVNDHGDAKITTFTVVPNHGPVGTKFSIDYVFVTQNGTGTGQVIMTINTIDKIPLAAGFLLEAQKPGTHAERVQLDARPDPDCDPDREKCEQWLPGKYLVTMLICNGECGSHHPHSQIYDTAKTTFVIDG